MREIINKYHERIEKKSDINQLLEHLYNKALECEHITEMGVREVVSTYAFLATQPKKLVSYDLGRYPEVDIAKELADKAGLVWEFHQKDVLQVDIEETDLLFIDTFHTATQLERELKLHAHKARKYIVLHDTTTYWEVGEPSNEQVADKATNCGRGLKHAVEPFLASHPEWVIAERYETNNGLMILKKA